MEDLPSIDPSVFRYQPPFIRNPFLQPPIRPLIPSDPSEAPDFEDMKVKRGDIITADSVNEMVGVMEKLYNRVQELEQTVQQSLMNRSGRVMEVEGIGRSRKKRLAENGIFTLYDLGTVSPETVSSILSVEGVDEVGYEEAERIVSDAYDLAGGKTGHSLTDLRSIGHEKANSLQQAGVQNLKEFSTADPQTIIQALNVNQEVAESLKNDAKDLIPGQ